MLKLNNKAESALSKLQDTILSPMEEALFKAWTKANQIEKPDNPDNHVDYRGIYKLTDGAVLPNGELKRIAERFNAEGTLQNVLQERMMDHIKKLTSERKQEAAAAEAGFAKEQKDASRPIGK